MSILSLIRVLYRAPMALCWTLTVHWIILWRRLLRPSTWGKRYGTDLIGRWGAGLAWIMGVRIVKRNERQGPMGDVIIANHMGFLDVPVLLACFPAVFIIKDEMRRVFYFGNALVKHGHVFVQRGSEASRRSAREGVRRVLGDGERLIVFPEGRASPGAERLPFKPFSFFEAQRQDKRIEACIIDYLPDRSMLKWDVNRRMVPQLIELFGRRRTEVSVEFVPSELLEDPAQDAQRYHDLIEGRLRDYDEERAQGAG